MEPHLGAASTTASAIGGTPRQLSGLTPRQIADAEANPLLVAIRREVKASEERLTERVMRVERRAEQFREAAFTSLDEKFTELKEIQPEYDRKLAEMSGCVNGVQEELQSLIRRVTTNHHAQSQSRTEETQAWCTKVAELEQQMQELVGGSGRLDLVEVQIERLSEDLAKAPTLPSRRESPIKEHAPHMPITHASSSLSPTMSQMLQCERAAREAEDAAERVAREAEHLSVKVQQALTQTEEQKGRIRMLHERVMQNEQQAQNVRTQAALSPDREPRTVLMPREPQVMEPVSSRQATHQPGEGLREEVNEIKFEMERHWKGILELKSVSEKFHRDLRMVKDTQETFRTELLCIRPSSPGSLDNGRSSAPVIDRDELLREIVAKSEVAIQALAPKLVEAECNRLNTTEKAESPKAKAKAKPTSCFSGCFKG